MEVNPLILDAWKGIRERFCCCRMDESRIQFKQRNQYKSPLQHAWMGKFQTLCGHYKGAVKENIYVQGSLTFRPFTASIPAKRCLNFLGTLKEIQGVNFDKTGEHQIQEVWLVKNIPGTGMVQRRRSELGNETG